MENSKKRKKSIGYDVDRVNTLYDDAKAYQKSLGLETTIPECVKYYEGKQWPESTPSTKTLPRPVINITEMIGNNRRSQVLSSPIRIVYRSESGKDDVEKFNRFAEYQQARLRQDDLNNKAALDGVIKGSWCFYYYWDSEVVGLDGLVEGDMGAQLIDCTNVLFANPNEKNEQKQEWIMIVSRENIESIKKMADKGCDLAKICEDSSDSYYSETESDTQKYATVITMFFRHKGEVYFQKSTKDVVFNGARPFTPDIKKAKEIIAGEEDVEETPQKEENQYLQRPKATLYPIVFDSWKERDKSIYGRGDVETIIPNQKAINWTVALQILMAQNEGMSPVVVSPDALRGQKITNAPGQVLTDYSKTGNGIKFVNKQGMTQSSVALADKLADLTRISVGSSEVMSGEVISAGMSGAAIAQLQSQALKPIEALQKKFWRSIEKVGEIYEQFFKFFYKGKKFTYKTKEKSITAGNNEKEVIKNDVFDSDKYVNVKFDVVAEAIAGTVMSNVADINLLDNLFAKGQISLKTYINCYPDNAIANREKLIEHIDNERNDQIAVLTQQNMQLQEQLQQAQAIVTEQADTVNKANSIINENNQLKEALIKLQSEYSKKMTGANQILKAVIGKATEFHKDAELMANEVAQQRGLKVQPNAPIEQQDDDYGEI